MDPFRDRLAARADAVGNWLCIGLDPDPDHFPAGLTADDTLDYCLGVVEATQDLACAYKPNAAFFEALGTLGHEVLAATIAAVPNEVPVILDGKRNDIGNTARKYAVAAFDELGADAVTVTPYLGRDTVAPFAEYEDKGVFLLARTSNASAGDLQDLDVGGRPLWRAVAETAMTWQQEFGNLGLVAGATYPEELATLRQVCGDDVPLLVPGVGAQGADAAETLARGADRSGRFALVNVGRAILYPEASDPAGDGDWGQAIRTAAEGFAKQLAPRTA